MAAKIPYCKQLLKLISIDNIVVYKTQHKVQYEKQISVNTD